MPRHAKNPHELLCAIGLKGMNFTNSCLSTGMSLAMPGDMLFGKIIFALFFKILGTACALRSRDQNDSFSSFAVKVSLIFI
jgi:hypothetical protein